MRTAGKPSEGQYSATDQATYLEFENRRKAISKLIFRYRQATYLEFENRRKAIRVGQYSATDRLYYLEFENRRKAISKPIFRYRQVIPPGI